jgi:hypothetical protein
VRVVRGASSQPVAELIAAGWIVAMLLVIFVTEDPVEFP